MFSKQHYEKIATLSLNSVATTKEEFLKEMAIMFKADNEKFKTQKFFMKSGYSCLSELTYHPRAPLIISSAFFISSLGAVKDILKCSL
jgi:hypothetical protein